jgi:hypothetical protein
MGWPGRKPVLCRNPIRWPFRRKDEVFDAFRPPEDRGRPREQREPDSVHCIRIACEASRFVAGQSPAIRSKSPQKRRQRIFLVSRLPESPFWDSLQKCRTASSADQRPVEPVGPWLPRTASAWLTWNQMA